MNRQYLQIGNAVPVALGAGIGAAVLAAVPAADTFSYEVQLERALRKLRASARNKVARSSNDTLQLL